MAPGRGRPRKQAATAAPHPNPSNQFIAESEISNVDNATEVGNLIAQLQAANGQPHGTANLTLQDLGAFEQLHDQKNGQEAIEEQPAAGAEAQYDDGDVIQLQQQELPYAKPARKRRLDDRQDDAVRVEWDGSQPSHAAEQPEPSQDEGFQTAQTVPQEMAQRRKRAAGMQRRQQAPEANMSSSANLFENNPDGVYTASTHPTEAYTAADDRNEEYDDSNTVDASHVETEPADSAPQQPKKKRKPGPGRRTIAEKERLAALPVEPLPDLSPSQAYMSVNRHARQQGAVQQQNGQKVPQKRTPWGPEEIDRLMLLIERHGTSWALLKQMDKKLTPEDGLMATRDQYALKDKARNMKADYLSSGIPLPPNFENVALSKKEVDRIQARRPEWMPNMN